MRVGASRSVWGPICSSNRYGPATLPPLTARKRIPSRETFQLTVVEPAGPAAAELLRQIRDLAKASQAVASEYVAPILDADLDGQRLWVASRGVEGRTAADWMMHHGRLPPELVLHVARSMVAGLVALEQRGLCHGDLSVAGLMLTQHGGVALLQPGLRGILRPEEGYAHADLRPEAYDTLAPERVADGARPTVLSDVYACGCVWWHLLCGRPPLGGGDSLSRLRAAQAAAVGDFRQWTYDVPEVLAKAVAACLQRDPRRRPESMARLAAMLGPPSWRGRRSAARCFDGFVDHQAPWIRPAGHDARRKRRAQLLTTSAVVLIGLAAVAWPVWRSLNRGPVAASPLALASPAADAVDVNVGQVGNLPHVSGDARSGKRDSIPAVQDDQVSPARFETAATQPDDPMVLTLPSDRPVKAESLRLKAGQCVRAAPGKLATLLVPPGGMTVAVDRIRFESIDFLQQQPATPGEADSSPPAMVCVSAARAEFHHCSFRTAVGSWALPTAIRWGPCPGVGQFLAIAA